MAAFYQQRFLDKLSFEIYEHLEPHHWDEFKLRKSGQIQWVKYAVRSLRDAVFAKIYIATGNFVFEKQDILAFYNKYFPEDIDFVNQIYQWKCNGQARARILAKFIQDSSKLFQQFRSLTTRLEKIVTKVNKLVI